MCSPVFCIRQTIKSQKVSFHCAIDNLLIVQGIQFNGSDEPVRVYQNGSTSENVYADTNCTIKIGSLNPREKRD